MDNILIEGKEIVLSKRDVETIYLVTLEEYLGEAGLTKEELIKFKQAEIDMLEIAQQKYIKVYRELPYLDDRTSELGNLLNYIAKQITNKTTKLNKYRSLI